MSSAPDLLERYRSERFSLFDISAGQTRYDELVSADGDVRPAWWEAVSAFARHGDEGVVAAQDRVNTLIADDGIIYNEVVGERTHSRPWRFDAVPLIIDGEEWAPLERGIVQRAQLLDLILGDLYEEQRLITGGLIPPELVYGHRGYIRSATRLRTGAEHALFLHAADLGRAPDGQWHIFADNTQAPSGIGYAVTDRKLLSRTMPRILADANPRPITTFVSTLANALADYAPSSVDDPTIVVLSPGSLSETAYDQAYLATAMGFPLVESADLVVRDGRLFMRSLGRLKRVDVVLRRVDDDFSDSLDLRTDSRLGVPGLVEVVSRGEVAVVNTIGSGVLQNPGLHPLLPRLCRELLDEDLLLPSVPTVWAGDDRRAVADRVDTLLVSNIHTGRDHVGPLLSAAERDELRAQIDATPWQWVGRELVDFSVAPGLVGERRAVAALPVTLRTFAVAQGTGYSVMTGGLGGSMAPGSAGSAGVTLAAKDVWVTSLEEAGVASRISRRAPDEAPAPRLGRAGVSSDGVTSPRVLSDLFWLGRYSERAEGTTRMLRVVRESHNTFVPRSGPDHPAMALLSIVAGITGTRSHIALADVDLSDPTVGLGLLTELTVAAEVPGTIAHAVEHMGASARGVRDQMSTSTWMVIGGIDRSLARLRAKTSTLTQSQDEVLRGLLAFAGLHNESMVHDPGWHFTEIGRRIERGMLLAQLVSGVLGPVRGDVDAQLRDSLLVAVESSVVYRRRYRSTLRLPDICALVLLDDTNPRSLIFQLTQLQTNLAALPDEMRSAGAERTINDLIAEVRRVDLDDLASVAEPVGDSAAEPPVHADLVELLTAQADGLADVSRLLARTRFAVPQSARAAEPLWGPRQNGDQR